MHARGAARRKSRRALRFTRQFQGVIEAVPGSGTSEKLVMRKRLRLFIFLVVVVSLGGVVALTGRAIWRQKQAELLARGLDLLPGVMQRLQNFRRVKVVDDRKVWEVAAEDAQYYEAEKMVLVRGAAVHIFLEDGRTIGLAGSEGRVYIDGKEVARVELSGGIEVTMADYKVKADAAMYDQERELVSTPGRVQISGAGLDVTAEGMEIDLASKSLRLLSQVAMNLEPATAAQDGGDHAPL